MKSGILIYTLEQHTTFKIAVPQKWQKLKTQRLRKTVTKVYALLPKCILLLGLTLDLRRYLVLFGMAIKAKSTPNKSFLNY